MHIFDPAEAALFTNQELFALKRSTTLKLYAAFEALRLRLKDTGDELQFSFPSEVLAISPKISQGENYRGCPWVMLDHHRYFKDKDMFAFRVMAWFGHYFSAHVVLGGRFLHLYNGTVAGNLQGSHVYFTLHDNPWEHAIEAPFCLPLAELTAEQRSFQVDKHHFVKYSICIQSSDLSKVIDEVSDFYQRSFHGI
jgi:hypothetical protein